MYEHRHQLVRNTTLADAFTMCVVCLWCVVCVVCVLVGCLCVGWLSAWWASPGPSLKFGHDLMQSRPVCVL